eukprot:4330289-Pleurochrysis_carterae.AAC.1
MPATQGRESAEHRTVAFCTTCNLPGIWPRAQAKLSRVTWPESSTHLPAHYTKWWHAVCRGARHTHTPASAVCWRNCSVLASLLSDCACG